MSGNMLWLPGAARETVCSCPPPRAYPKAGLRAGWRGLGPPVCRLAAHDFWVRAEEFTPARRRVGRWEAGETDAKPAGTAWGLSPPCWQRAARGSRRRVRSSVHRVCICYGCMRMRKTMCMNMQRHTKGAYPYRTKTRRRPRKQTRLSAQPAAMKATRRQLRSSSERVSDLVSICSFRLACEYSLGAGGVRARLETARWSSLLMLRVDARLSER